MYFVLPSRGLALRWGTLVGAALLLTGCSSGSEPLDQDLSVTYLDGGTAVEVTVDVPDLECTELAGSLRYSADGEDANEWGILTAGATEASDSYSLSIRLGDGLWFVSTGAFENDNSGVGLSDLEGIVMPITFEDRMPDYGQSIDTAATATGALECTSTR